MTATIGNEGGVSSDADVSNEPTAASGSVTPTASGTVVVLLGAPGAGKGTQAQILSEKLRLTHVATGDLFRAAVREGTALGIIAKGYMDRGELVPDNVTIQMLFEQLDKPESAAGILLDGFPRNPAQAEALDAALAERGSRVASAPLIEVPAELLLARLSGRWICRAEGHPYHELSKPPRVAGVCDIDGSELYQRSDDRTETVLARLRQQLGALELVVEHYRKRGVLLVVDGCKPIDEVAEELLTGLRPIVAASH